MSKNNYIEGDAVAWKWANGVAEGKIVRIVQDRVQIETKGKIITRNGSKKNPALVIKHNSGTNVLKLASEVQKTS